ncbi:MAG: lipoate--protein ligase family protein [Candidatus Aminicenantes bacterium]|nr:lipoate--protein ligase family protein [Candidatus Aminicenantes bacterium]MCK5004329.1 lipoate--protein ligase family protein [Candidatus Aminicenantes bacterium]
MSSWYFIEEKKALSPSMNMAIDEYLFNLCHNKSIGFFRIYSWDRPTFSIGVSQKVSKAVDLNYINENKFGFVRRITGGKTVLHNDEITYSVVSSEERFFLENDLYKSYSLIADIILKALIRSDIKAELSEGSSTLLSKSSNPCFSFPTPNEIEVSGKKIVGSAQKRDKLALLQHGSIPLSMNFEIYSGGTGFSARAIRRSMTTISDVSVIKKDLLIKNFYISFEEFIGKKMLKHEYSEKDRNEIGSLAQKYETEKWNLSI